MPSAVRDAAPPVGRASTSGRPPSTSRRELALAAMRLFSEQGFEQTTVDQIAAAAGVSRRTFFRYFTNKSAVLWNDFDLEVQTITRLLAEVPSAQPMMEAIRGAVVAANHYQVDDLPELRARINLLATVPTLQADATLHYDAWERAISAFVAARTGDSPESLWPLMIGRTTLAACRAAYDRWSARVDGDLTRYLDAALVALAAGFDPDRVPDSPERPRRRSRR